MPIYNIENTYQENLKKGPQYQGEFPSRIESETSYDFLGFRVASPIGVAAGPLLDSRWVDFAAKMGFDILTYKTIRSKKHTGHPLPNMIYVDPNSHLDSQAFVYATQYSNENIDQLAVTNSFGIPSQDQKFLREDIEQARRCLKKTQVLVVSVVASPHPQRTLKQDFIYTAQFAKDCGAQVIEANFSCPNIQGKQSQLYLDLENADSFSKALVKAIAPSPLIIKLGYVKNIDILRSLLCTFDKNGVAAVSAINTISKKVLKADGSHAMGETRPSSGICGSIIRPYALDFTRQARSIVERENLHLKIITVGGLVRAEHFSQSFDMGADFAQSASGMMWDPLLAYKYHQAKALRYA